MLEFFDSTTEFMRSEVPGLLREESMALFLFVDIFLLGSCVEPAFSVFGCCLGKQCVDFPPGEH